MPSFPRVKYTGATPGADANTYNLLNSITGGWPGNWPALFGVHKVLVDIKHDQAGTLKVYKNMGDTDANWLQVDQVAVVAPAATGSTQLEVLVEAYRHLKLDWTNGGVAQSPFAVDLALADDRSAA